MYSKSGHENLTYGSSLRRKIISKRFRNLLISWISSSSEYKKCCFVRCVMTHYGSEYGSNGFCSGFPYFASNYFNLKTSRIKEKPLEIRRFQEEFWLVAPKKISRDFQENPLVKKLFLTFLYSFGLRPLWSEVFLALVSSVTLPNAIRRSASFLKVKRSSP